MDVPLSAVADAARIRIATLYRNFPTRDDLIRAVVEDLADCFRAVEDDYLTRIDKDPDQGWHDFVHALAALRPGTLIPALAEKFGDTGTPTTSNRCARGARRTGNAPGTRQGCRSGAR